MYKKRKKKNLLYISIILIVLLFIGLFFNITSDNRNLIFIEKIGHDIGYISNKLVYNPINYLRKTIGVEKYKDCNIDEKNSNISELESKVEDLQKLLELNNRLENVKYKNANVINRNIGYWYETLTIDIGEKDGLKKGDTVINSDGLIGYIVKTSYLSSSVKLLTNEYLTKTSVKIDIGDKFLYGILTSYDRKENNFIIEGISENDEIKANDLVTTTGFGNNYYPGILIGKVVEISSDNYDLTKIVKVKSSVNFNNINYVTVIIGNEEQ